MNKAEKADLAAEILASEAYPKKILMFDFIVMDEQELDLFLWNNLEYNYNPDLYEKDYRNE